VGTDSTLYVRTSGSDSSACTSTAPCRTIAHAVAVAASGDSIDVGTGTFVEGAGVVSNKDLTIKGFTWLGTRVTPNSPSTDVFTIQPGAQVVLRRMNITGGGVGIHNLGGLTYFPGCDIGCRLLVLTSTKAHPLLQGSPAIDTAGDVYCTPTDRLGTARPAGPHCDMGAYEYQPGGNQTR
jgi:hypothetical protein